MGIRLTSHSVEEVQPADKEVVLWDADLPGFGLRVKPSGVRSYIIQYRNTEGRSRRLTLGRHGVLTPDEARQQARAHLAAARSGGDPAAEARPARRRDTLAGLCERYLSDYAEPNKKPSSLREDRRLIAKRILPALGGRPIAAVDGNDVARLHGALADKPYEANRTLALLRKMFNLAEDWGLRGTGDNPCRTVAPYDETAREAVLAADDLARLGRALDAAEADFAEDLAVVAALRLLLLTGFRLSEVLTLTWDAIDWDTGCAVVDERRLFLGKPALTVLGDLPYVSDFALPAVTDPDRPLSVSTIEHAWRRIRKTAGLPKARLNDLRHTFTACAAALGYAAPLAEAPGRRSRAFDAPPPDGLRAAADRVAGEMAARLEPPKPKKKKAGKAKK